MTRRLPLCARRGEPLRRIQSSQVRYRANLLGQPVVGWHEPGDGPLACSDEDDIPRQIHDRQRPLGPLIDAIAARGRDRVAAGLAWWIGREAAPKGEIP